MEIRSFFGMTGYFSKLRGVSGREDCGPALERLREQVIMDPIPGLPINDRVTLSIGIATWEGAEDSAEQMLSRADKALYRAKADGRNRVVA